MTMYHTPKATWTATSATETDTQAGSVYVIPKWNPIDLTVVEQNDLELVQETDMGNEAPFETTEDRIKPTLPCEVRDHLRRDSFERRLARPLPKPALSYNAFLHYSVTEVAGAPPEPVFADLRFTVLTRMQ